MVVLNCRNKIASKWPRCMAAFRNYSYTWKMGKQGRFPIPFVSSFHLYAGKRLLCSPLDQTTNSGQWCICARLTTKHHPRHGNPLAVYVITERQQAVREMDILNANFPIAGGEFHICEIPDSADSRSHQSVSNTLCR